jgi:hypothetical protein|tara:strand:- start:156 stop:299 length:144 start_codon:yes stop_codon:yes gene_type:complete
MIQHHGWGLEDIENMIPWEREIYVELLIKHIKEENQRVEEENRKMKQ